MRMETGSAVARVLVEKGRAAGILLEDGREVRARRVVANVNPRMLYLQMLEPADVDADVRLRMQRYRAGSASFRMNVALSELRSSTAAAFTAATSTAPASSFPRRWVTWIARMRMPGPRACRASPSSRY